MLRIENGRTKFYQWDVDQRLVVDTPDIGEVHFANYATSPALVCEVYEENGERLVNVPNILLQQPRTLIAYGCCAECVRAEVRFDVDARQKPADYVYTETEIKKYSDLDERIANLEAGFENVESGIFRVRLESLTDGVPKVDKTFAEIQAALDEGMLVELASDIARYPFVATQYITVGTEMRRAHVFDTVTGGTQLADWVRFEIFDDDTAVYTRNHWSVLQLPNPKRLVVNANGKTFSYRGDAEVVIDLSGFATKEEIPDVSGFATKKEIPDVSGFATKKEIPTDTHIAEVAKTQVTWENIPDKPFGTGGVILPLTVLNVDADSGMAYVTPVMNLEVGKTYIVTWNGVKYECTAVEQELDGMMCVWVGNLGVMTEGGEPGPEPFVVGALPAEVVAEMRIGGVAASLDGSVNPMLMIEGGGVKTLDPIYLPMNAIDARIDEKLGVIENGTY